MTHIPATRLGRSGQVAPLIAILLVPLMGMLAFSVDVGYMVVVRTQLQNSADAAALAGAQQLMNPSVQYITPGNASVQASILSNAIASAKSTAKAVAAQNTAGGVTITIADADVDVGYTASDGTYTSTSGLLPVGAFPNTVKVTGRRDSTQNNEVSMFFGPVMGKSTIGMQAVAAATTYTVTLDGPNGPGEAILPMTFDQNMYQQFVNTGTLPNNNLITGSDGNKQIQLYPSIKDTGNFGLLSLNDGSHDANTIRGWINNGVSQSDVNALKNANLVPLSSHPANTFDWSGAPGFKSSDVQDLNSSYVPGQTYVLPLFTPKVAFDPLNPNSYQPGVGNGSNLSYDITSFVAVTITSDPNDNRNVYMEPAATVLDYNKILTTGSPGVGGQPGATLTTSTIFIAPRLTQ